MAVEFYGQSESQPQERALFPRKAEKFSPEAVDALMNLNITENKDCLNLAVTVLIIFTSMRIQDAHRIFCDRITKVPYVDSEPHHLQFILEQTKNDIQGTGPLVALYRTCMYLHTYVCTYTTVQCMQHHTL